MTVREKAPKILKDRQLMALVVLCVATVTCLVIGANGAAQGFAALMFLTMCAPTVGRDRAALRRMVGEETFIERADGEVDKP